MANLLHGSFIFSISLIIGCAGNIRTANQLEECSVESRRGPSSLCRHLSKKKEYLSPEISRRIDEAFEELRLQYGFIPDVHEGAKASANAIDHYKLISKNPKLLETYLDAGFTISKLDWYGAEELILKSPHDIRDIFKNLMGLILNVEPNLSKVVLPAFIFQRGTEFKHWTPGFDALPSKSEGWQLVTKSIQLNNQIFEQAYAEGKLGLTVDAGFLFHDISHLIDGAYQPNMMRLLRTLFGKIARRDKDLNWDISDPNIGTYINEFLITANIKNKALIESLILDRARLPDSQKRIDIRSEIRSNNFWKRLERIHEEIFNLLEIHGGAALDGYNLKANTSIKLRQTIYKYAIGEREPKNKDFESYLTHDSFWGLIQQMLLLKAVLTKNFEGFTEFAGPIRPSLKKLSNEIDEPMKQRLESALIELFIELEARIGMALKNKISSERIIEDLMSPDYQGTRTYEFFESVARPGGLEEQLFVKAKSIL